MKYGKNNSMGFGFLEFDTADTIIHGFTAFEAAKNELHQLFSLFAQSLRIQTSFKKHRGFNFVEDATKQETKNALQALSNTHLYGCHPVGQWG
ncbi:LOW QUALITY PROTEIN: hypothetical protein M8C21_001048, partial [Ambrosia artemisiifolia]